MHKHVTVVPGTVVSLPAHDVIGSFEDYNTYLNAKYENEELESDNQKRDDIGAKKVLKQTLSVENGFILQTCDLETRNEAIKKLREKGFSIRLIERLTETNVPGTFVS